MKLLKHRLLLIGAFALISTKTLACAGAGMTQYFPLATNSKGQIWVLSIQTIRSAQADFFEFNSHLILTNSKLEVIDSVFVYQKKNGHFNLNGHNMEAAFDAHPLDLIDSVYNLGVETLNAKSLSLRWLKLVGYSRDGEHADGPLKFLRSTAVHHYSDTSTYRGKDTIYQYSDTTNTLNAIHYFQYRTDSVNILSFSPDMLDYGLNYRDNRIMSSRLYQASSGDFILILHFNIMGPGFYEGNDSWHSCSQLSFNMCSEAKDQPLTWHHGGNDCFVFLDGK